MLLVYSDHSSARLHYILATIFSEIIPCPYRLTSDKNEFLEFSDVKINYSPDKITENELWVFPHPLLFEDEIKPQITECFRWNESQVFFKTEGDFPFDIFAASFYLITRYEEYLTHNLDEYGRYAYTNSLAFKENFLHLPLVNLWLKELKNILQHKSPGFKFRSSGFKFIPTYDIDIAYNYHGKKITRNIGGILWSIVNGKWALAAERINVLSERKKDPSDIYRWLDELHRQYNLQPVYFFLLAKKRSGYDKNISPDNKLLQQLIAHQSSTYKTGIHPSWQSGDDTKALKNEIDLLKNITGKDVTASRQHYIRMKLPETYRLLIANKIMEDYSMGYGSINGFRASVASAFFWFDLKKNESTSLKIFPFCFMEANSYFEQHFSVLQAGKELQQYYEVLKEVNGFLITIFHNHFLTDQFQWKEWKKMYVDFLKINFSHSV